MKKLVYIFFFILLFFNMKAQIPVIDGVHIGTNQMSWQQQLQKALQQYQELVKENKYLNEYLELYRKISAAVRESKRVAVFYSQMNGIERRANQMRNVKNVASQQVFFIYKQKIDEIVSEANEVNEALNEVLEGQNGQSPLTNPEFSNADWGSIGNENLTNILQDLDLEGLTGMQGDDLNNMLSEMGLEGLINNNGNSAGGMGGMGGGMDLGGMGGGMDLGGMGGGMDLGGMGGGVDMSALNGLESLMGGLGSALLADYNVDDSKMRMNDGERLSQINTLINKLTDLYSQLENEEFKFKKTNNHLFAIQHLKKIK